MPVNQFLSNILEGVGGTSQQAAPVPVGTPPPPTTGGFTLPFGLSRPMSERNAPSPPVDRDTSVPQPPQLYDPKSGLPPNAGDYYYASDPNTGRVTRYEYSGGDIITPAGWVSADQYFPPSGGGAGSDPAYLAETVRANMAREAEQRRRRALDAASNAASAYLTGTQLSDTRRLNAFQESRALLPFLVDPEQEFFGGQEPGGIVDRTLQQLGIPGFKPSEIQHKQLTPAQLALPPSPEQVGSDIVDYIGDVQEGGI